jgi:hypothetical protein
VDAKAPRLGSTLALALAASFAAPSARASLAEDAERIRTGLTRWGAPTEHLGTVFGFEGVPRELGLPKPTANEPRCRSIVAVSERNMRFTLAPSGPGGDSRPPSNEGRNGEAVASRAGVAVLHDCGPGARLGRVRVVVVSPRAAVELLLARHDGALPPVGLVAPDRAVGPASRADWWVEPLRPEPLAVRLGRAEQAARLAGATLSTRVQTTAGERGEGSVALKLPAGCHRIGVLGAAPNNPTAPLDVDAEARSSDGQRLLARDRSTAPDALLELCVGEADVVLVRYGGAPGRGAVTVLDSLWPLPVGLDPLWSPDVRAGLAWAVFRRGAPAPRTAATLQVLGGQGTTIVPVAVEPGSCYLAAVALRRGQASATRLSASLGDRTVVDQATAWPHAAAVSFCAGDAAEVPLVVELRSTLAWWQLDLWRLAGGAR